MMDKESFKIGDKVKVCKPQLWRQGNRIGKVIEIHSFYVRVSYEGNHRGVLYVPSEIYKVSMKGQQLEFEFMKGG